MVVEFESPAFLAPIEIEGLDLLTQIGQLAQEEVPATRRAADSDRQLAQAAERNLAIRATR
jgi:hypothetical protein